MPSEVDHEIEIARLTAQLTAWKQTERWLAGASAYLAKVEIPALVRTLQRKGLSRQAIAALLGDDGASLSIPRVDQIAAHARRFEDGTSDTDPPPWFGGFGAVPPEGYNPLEEIARLVRPALPLP